MKLLIFLALLVTGITAHDPKEVNRAVKELSRGRVQQAHATLRTMDPAELEEYLNNEGGREQVSKFFPNQEAEEALGAYVPRTKFNSEEDQRKHEQR